MTARIIEFPTAPGRFASRIEVQEFWSHGGALCHWRVVALDHNGAHVVDSFSDPDEAERFADSFRLAHRELFGRDIARREASRGGRGAPAPWWLQDVSDHRQTEASHDCPPDPWFPGDGGAA